MGSGSRRGVTAVTQWLPWGGITGGTISAGFPGLRTRRPGPDMKHRWIMAAALAAHGMAPMAQTIYESKDKAGTVFSDRRSVGSAVVSPYRRFVINRPSEQDTVHTHTGEFSVSASVSPPLRSSDRIRVLLDGNLVPNVYRGTNLRISESDWQSAATGTQGEHRIQLTIVDADGTLWIETAPVSFHVLRTGVGGARP
jgi:hypothetical protein